MRGDEHIPRDEGVAGGTPHPGGVPGVLDDQLRGGNQHQGLVRDRTILVLQECADRRPGRVRRAGVVRPAAADPPAARHPLPDARRCSHTGHPCIRVGSEHLLLGLIRKQARQPVRHGNDHPDPGRRAVGFAEGLRDIGQGAQIRLLTAVSLRCQQPEDAGVGQRMDDLGWYDAVPVTASGVFPQQRPQRGRRRDRLGRGTGLDRPAGHAVGCGAVHMCLLRRGR